MNIYIKKVILISTILSPTFSFCSSLYNCKIDTIKNIRTNEFTSLKKNKRLKIAIEKHSNYVYLRVGKESSKLNFIKSSKIFGYLNADIYTNGIEQLEIIDIEKSYGVGARYFYKDKMYVIGSCKK